MSENDRQSAATQHEEVVAYEYEVKSPYSNEWRKHIDPAEDLPEHPEEVWRDDHDIRNVRPLRYADVDEDQSQLVTDGGSAESGQATQQGYEFKSGTCAFCGHEDAQNEVFLYTMEDYAATNLDETPPVRRMFLCGQCYDETLPRTEVMAQSEVPGLDE